MKLKRMEDLILREKRVLTRVDFNVPIRHGKVADNLRIEAALPTIDYLIKQKAKLILMSHLGRPDGKPNEAYSLEPVAVELSRLLKREVLFLHDCIGDDIAAKVMSLRPGQVVLLENLRFHAEEEAGDARFSHQLAQLGEVYVNDAFGSDHRAHASIVGPPKLLPHGAGKLLQSEVEHLTRLMTAPKHPFVAIIGGAKITDKIDFVRKLLHQADTVVISGAMANTFLAAQGHDMQASVLDRQGLAAAHSIMQDAKKHSVELILPVDVVVAKSPSSKRTRTVTVGQLDEDDMALDIGPASVTNINVALHGAHTVFWNGTLGYTEEPQFARASLALAKTLAVSKAQTVIGGGDTAGFIHELRMTERYSFASTGGGAALELLAGKVLPGVKALLLK